MHHPLLIYNEIYIFNFTDCTTQLAKTVQLSIFIFKNCFLIEKSKNDNFIISKKSYIKHRRT